MKTVSHQRLVRLGAALFLGASMLLHSAHAYAQSCTPTITAGGVGYNSWTTIVADYNNTDYLEFAFYGRSFVVYKNGANVRLQGVDSNGLRDVNLTTSTTSITHTIGESSNFDVGIRLSGTAVQARTYSNDQFTYHTYKGCSGSSGDNLGNHTATQALNMGGFAVNNAAGYFHGSDRNLKTDIKPVSGLDILKHLTGVSFTWKDDGHASMGVIAQEMEQVMPQAVHTDPKTGLKSVEYDQLIAPLIQATKELDAKNAALEEDMRALREELRALKQTQR